MPAVAFIQDDTGGTGIFTRNRMPMGIMTKKGGLMSHIDFELQSQFTDEQYRVWREGIHRAWVEGEWYRKPYPNPMPTDRMLDKIRAMTTRELLGILQKIRKVGGHWYSPVGSDSYVGYFLDDVKAELAKRPHVPSRAEAKGLRRKRALGHAR